MQPTGSKNTSRTLTPAGATPTTAQQQAPTAPRGLFSGFRLAITRRNRDDGIQQAGALQTLSASPAPVLGTTPALRPPTVVVEKILGYLDLKSQAALASTSKAEQAVVASSNDMRALAEIELLRGREEALGQQADELEQRARESQSAPASAFARARARVAGKSAMSADEMSDAAASVRDQIKEVRTARGAREVQFLNSRHARGFPVPNLDALVAVEKAINVFKAGGGRALPWPELFEASAVMRDSSFTAQLYSAYRQPPGMLFEISGISRLLTDLRDQLVSTTFAMVQGGGNEEPAPSHQSLTVRFSSSPVPDDPTLGQILTMRHTDTQTGEVASQKCAVVGIDRREHVFKFADEDGREFYYVHTFNEKVTPPVSVMDQPD